LHPYAAQSTVRLGNPAGKIKQKEDKMRRSDKQITDRKEIAEVITKCQVCRVGLAKENQPYIVPVSFGYDGKAIYFHSATQGAKNDYIRANNRVCFEFEHGVKIQSHDDQPCNWSFSFQSVIGFGSVAEIVSDEDKIRGLQCIMAQYSNRKWDFDNIPLTGVAVWKITIESMTGKQSKDFFDGL